jgi:predicted amidohydrolase
VFRDGHREEVNRYVIQGDVIYASADYWSTGSWSNRIPMSQLDVLATVKANRERGVQFDLPSGPNEVVVYF